MSVTTPVAFIVFNRPEQTRDSFARIRDQKPRQLFVIADGPRDGHPTDRDRCDEVRDLVGGIDWPCDVRRNYADTNMGCKKRVGSGLEWVFSMVDRAIVLEDDCVAHPDFFSFCDALLDRYADDPRVAVVTGGNFQQGRRRGDASYYFSRYNHVWGWATWRRAWDRYDEKVSFWVDWQSSNDWLAAIPDRVERRYWEGIFDRVARGEIDTWDYQWTACTWYHGGLTATPNVNLVRNIGFGPEATHSRSLNPALELHTSPLGPLVHPRDVQRDAGADRFVFDHLFGGASLRSRRRPLGFLRWLLGRVLRGIMSASPVSVGASGSKPQDRGEVR